MLLLIGAFAAPGWSESVTAYVFWRAGCPHCANARAALGELESQVEELRVEEIELGVSAAHNALFLNLLVLFEVENPAVPFVVIGDRYVIGFATGGVTRQVYRDLVDRCRANACPDLVADLRRLSALATGRGPPADGALGGVAPTTVTIPFLGSVELAALSLPMLTIVLAGIDGFNPCAIWVLVLLIGMLLGVTDARRMWTLGLVFLLATGAMYFAVMAAWLNVVLWVGAVISLRIAASALALRPTGSRGAPQVPRPRDPAGPFEPRESTGTGLRTQVSGRAASGTVGPAGRVMPWSLDAGRLEVTSACHSALMLARVVS